MAITEFSKQYHERIFSGYESRFLETDPEFIEFFDNFAFDEVINVDDLDDRTRMIAILYKKRIELQPERNDYLLFSGGPGRL